MRARYVKRSLKCLLGKTRGPPYPTKWGFPSAHRRPILNSTPPTLPRGGPERDQIIIIYITIQRVRKGGMYVRLHLFKVRFVSESRIDMSWRIDNNCIKKNNYKKRVCVRRYVRREYSSTFCQMHGRNIWPSCQPIMSTHHVSPSCRGACATGHVLEHSISPKQRGNVLSERALAAILG